jgi:retron-type reverse transcriptase
VILKCIHENQYGFLKSKSIHDCVAWTFEYLHQYQASKSHVVVLKLDFVKAFDTIEHDAILMILEKMRFDSTWLGWIIFFFPLVSLPFY